MGLEEFQSHYMFTPYFKLKITETQTEKALDWKKTWRHLFAYEGQDASFRANHKQILKQFEEYQLELTTFPGIDIELDVKPPRKLTPEKQLEYLKALTTVVSEAVSHSAKAEKDHPMRPRFNIDAIYLDIGDLHIRHDIVQQLQELLALNVTIKKLTIQPTVTPEKSGPQLWRSAWAALLFTICGHPGASVKPGKPIEHLHLVQPSLSE
ncbi:hypothetical protein Poli38472_011171 [Pythium oligandrum]|uniref:Uncharacterized protein n=1 Tax=Pythium oligandrum TaxID=41045 RepID=A0A8K1CPR0_PYTOL|nr:hypothetical protein Poli38472_011171 [Pythium oligandrum]|eukprot:TMW67551.1 hypothetical protein Poli38472_011171 [Pythium oligandrum]